MIPAQVVAGIENGDFEVVSHTAYIVFTLYGKTHNVALEKFKALMEAKRTDLGLNEVTLTSDVSLLHTYVIRPVKKSGSETNVEAMILQQPHIFSASNDKRTTDSDVIREAETPLEYLSFGDVTVDCK